MTESTIAQFNDLRLLLETKVASPAVVVVTAATDTDGTRFAAFGLADSLAASGHRTLFVRASEDGDVALRPTALRKTEDFRSPRLIGEHGLFALDASEERLASTSSRDAVATTLRRWRDEHSYVIVDAGAFPKHTLAAMLTSIADATLVALRNGRSRCSGDIALASAIEATPIPVLGIVSTTKKSIQAFEKLELVEHPAKPRFVNLGNVAATL